MNKRQANGKLIAKARKKHSKTQSDMTKICNVNKSTISQIENGKFSGSLDIFERYIDSLGLQLTVQPKEHQLPSWDELDDMFLEDE